jgi:hypothetical protein
MDWQAEKLNLSVFWPEMADFSTRLRGPAPYDYSTSRARA